MNNRPIILFDTTGCKVQMPREYFAAFAPAELLKKFYQNFKAGYAKNARPAFL